MSSSKNKIQTRSQTRDTSRPKMTLSEDDKEFFAAQLANQTASNNNLISEMKVDIIKSINALEEKLAARIQLAENKIAAQQTTINNLNERIDNQDKVISDLVIQANSTEQYTRRESVRIHRIPSSESETQEKTMATIRKCHEDLGLPFSPDLIARAHRIGKQTEKNGTSYNSIIVKFKQFSDKSKFYKARPTSSRSKSAAGATGSSRGRGGSSSTRERNIPNFRVSLDLTQSNYKLLDEARTKIQSSTIKYAFADHNYNLGV